MSGVAGSVLVKIQGAGGPCAAKGFLGIVAPRITCLNNYSSDVRPKSETGRKSRMSNVTGDVSEVPSLTAMKRGTGYRSSFSGQVATIFGCTGGLAKVVVSRLGKSGTQMIFPYRGDASRTRRLRVAGDLGQTLFTEYHLKDAESIRKAMMYSDTVINLIGREYETRNFKFEDVNIHGPRLLAKLARECGVKNFIHISHLQAAENPKTLFLPNGSDFLRTKYFGEKAVLEEFPDATIFRPCDMYGHLDYFVDYYVQFHRMGYHKSVPLWKKGNYTVKAPLYYGDLASGILAAIDNQDAKGVTYEAFGPDRFLMADLMDWMHEVMHKACREWGYRRTDMRIDPFLWTKTLLVGNIPLALGKKQFRGPTVERLDRTQLSDDPQGLPNLEDLGVKGSKVQDKMPFYLDRHRAFRHHAYYYLEDLPVVHPLKPLTRLEERNIMANEVAKGDILHYLGLKA